MSGANPTIGITITAADLAQAKIDAVNKRIEKMNGPADRASKSFSRFADMPAMGALGRNLRTVAQHSLSAFENMTRMVGPLGTITSAASVAGMAGLAAEWARFNQQLGFSAQRAGMSAGELNGLRGAAMLAGSSAQSLTSGMTALNDNLFNAAAGRAPEAVRAFNFLGVAFADTAGHSRRATDVLPELADKIAGIKDPSIQAQIATMLFGGAAEDLLPTLRGGSALLAEHVLIAKRYNDVTPEMTAAANRLQFAQTELGLAFQGVTNQIVSGLEPAITPLLHDMAEWIHDHPKLTEGITGTAAAISAMIATIGTLRLAWLAVAGAAKAAGAAEAAAAAGGAGAAAAGAGAAAAGAGGAAAGAAGVGIAAPVAGLAIAGAAAGVATYKNSQNSATGQDLAAQRGFTEVTGTDESGMPTRYKNPTTGEEHSAVYFDPRYNPSINAPAAGVNAPAGTTAPAVDMTMNATKRGFLDTLAGPESGGAYNIKNGGSRFNDFSRFPEGIGPGGTSTASGRYQFISSTWQSEAAKLGLHDFSPGSQDKAAWDLAASAYRARTGGDLEADLRAGNKQGQIASALASIWPSLPGGSQSRESQGQFDMALAQNTARNSGPSPGIDGGTGGTGGAGEAKVSGGATLDIRLAGFPNGTTHSADASGNIWSAPPRVEQAMPFGGAG
jgi:muramidase (phage lysozyme)